MESGETWRDHTVKNGGISASFEWTNDQTQIGSPPHILSAHDSTPYTWDYGVWREVTQKRLRLICLPPKMYGDSETDI